MERKIGRKWNEEGKIGVEEGKCGSREKELGWMESGREGRAEVDGKSGSGEGKSRQYLEVGRRK